MVSLAACLWLRFLRRPWSRLINRFYPGKRRRLPAVATLRDIEAVLAQIRWTPDSLGDWIRDPELTWGKKQGDCEDMAVLVMELLKQTGIQGRLLSVVVRPARYSHAVCVFSLNGKYHYFSNSKLIENEYQTVYNIVKFVQGTRFLVCWSLENSAGKTITLKRGM